MPMQSRVHRNFFTVEQKALDAINAVEMMPDDYMGFLDRVNAARTIKELREVIADIGHGCEHCAAGGRYVPAERYYGYFVGYETRRVFHGYLCEQCAQSEDYVGLRKAES